MRRAERLRLDVAAERLGGYITLARAALRIACGSRCATPYTK